MQKIEEVIMSFSEAGHTVCITIIIFLSETNLAYKFNLHCCCVVHKQKYMHGVQQISSDVQCTRVIIPSGINYSGIFWTNHNQKQLTEENAVSQKYKENVYEGTFLWSHCVKVNS